MKILILDDSVTKIQRIYKVLTGIDNIQSENICHVNDVMNAKVKLKQEKFDLLILDLNMPEEMTSDASGMSGFELIEELTNTNQLNLPNHVIALTEYDSLKENYETKKYDHVFPVIKYSQTSLEWEEKIKRKVKYIMKTEKNEDSRCDFDVALITAVSTETKAVRKAFGEWSSFSIPNDPTIYYKTSITRSSENISIVSAEQTNMGMVEASILSTKILLNFAPKYLIMPGIAAGLGNNHFGDILFPNSVYDYSCGKYVSEDENMTFEPDPKFCDLSQDIIEKAKQDFSEVLHNIRSNFDGDKPSDALSLISDGPLACGAAVVANKQIVNEYIKNHVRKAIGLDMESYGVFRACKMINTNCTPICIKSICDFADNEKNDKYQKYAAYTSAAFAKYFIETQLNMFSDD